MKILRQHPAALDPISPPQARSSIVLMEKDGQFFTARYHHDRRRTYDHVRYRGLVEAEVGYARRLHSEAVDAMFHGWADVPAISPEQPAGLFANHFLHSFVAHPIMALLHLLGLDRAGNFVHDRLIVEP